jgi:hypothetical protein
MKWLHLMGDDVNSTVDEPKGEGVELTRRSATRAGA